MFCCIILLCLVQFSVGTIIRGRILLNGDVNQNNTVPTNSQLLVRFENRSITHASGNLLKEIEVSNLIAFPIDYQIRVSSKVPSASSYSLSARIKKGDTFLYVSEQNIPVTIGSDSIITIDIPFMIVREDGVSQPLLNEREHLSWPELVGREGTYAVEYIKAKTGLTNVYIVPEGSMVTMDYRTDRVRVFINKKGIVTEIPSIG